MARIRKRKKVNKKVVAVLAVLGLAVVALGGLMLYKYLPRDPIALKQKSEAALADSSAEGAVNGKNYPEAQRYLKEAIGAAERSGRDDLYVEYLIELSEMNLEWLDALDDPAGHEIRKRLSMAREALEAARRAAPDNVEVLEKLASLYLTRTGQQDPYLDVMGDLIQEDPNDPELRFNRAVVLAREARKVHGKEGLEAIEGFRKAIELDPNNAAYRVVFADFLYDYERTTQAEEVYRKALKDLPGKSIIARRFGQFLARNNRHQAAREQFSTAIKADPNEPSNHMAMASFLMTRREFDDAEVYLDQAEELDPNNPNPQRLYSQLYLRRNEFEKGVAKYGKFVELYAQKVEKLEDPSKRQLRRVGEVLASLHAEYANMLLELVRRQPGNKEKLLAEARESLKVIGEHRSDSPEYAKIKGHVLLLEGNADQAIDMLEEAHKKFKADERIDPRTGDLLAGLYLAQGRPGKAESILKELEGAGRRTGRASLLEAQIAINNRNYARASQALDAVLARNPTHARALNLSMAVRVILSEKSRLPEELDITPGIRSLLLREADRRWLEGNRAQAIALVENMYRRQPEQLSLVNRLGSYYRRNGQADKSRALLEEASRIHPDNQQIKHALKLLDTEDPKERYKLQMAALKKIEDPISRRMAKAQVAAIYKKADQAVKFWTEAAELAMEDPSKPDGRAGGLVARLLQILVKQDKTAKVDAWLDRAAKADLDRHNGKIFRADVAMARDNYKKVVSLLEPLHEGRSESKTIATRLGRAYLQLQLYEKARDALESALANDSGYEPAVIAMMQVSAVVEPTEYPDWVRRAYRLAPQNSQVRSAYLDLQQREQADPAELLAQRQQLYRSNPRNIPNSIQLAMLYEKNDQPAEAEKIYRFLYDKLKRKLVGAELLARFYQRTDQSDKARELIDSLRKQEGVDPVEANLLEAQILARTDFSAARKAIERAMEADPEDPRPYRLLSNLWMAAGKPDEAIRATEALLRETDGTAGDEKRLIRLLMDTNRNQRALQRIENLLARDGEDAEALMLKGVALMKPQIGKPKEAMRALNKAIELRPRYAEPLRYRATLHQYQGDLSSAVTDLRRARDLEGDRRTSLRLARLLAQRGEFVRAEDIYKSMLRGNPDDRDALDGLTNLYMQQSNWLSLERLIKQRKEMHPDSTAPYLAEARMWAQRGNDGRRVRALSRAVQVARTPATFAAYLRGLVQTGRHQQTLDALEGDVPQGLEQLTPLIRAAALAGTGKTSEADNMFRRILQRGSTAMAMQVVPMAVAGYGSEDGAKKLFRWIDLRPRDGHYIHQVARLMQSLQEEGALRRAAQLHRQVVDLAADGSMLQGQAFTGLGVAEYHLGNYKEARDAYLKALAIRRNDIQALNNLAYLFVDGLNQPADGLKYAKRAIEVQPRNPNVLDTYGWALAHTGRLTEARKALERAVRLSRTPVTLHHLGWVYEKADNLTDALRTYRDAVLLIEEGAGDPELKSTLNQAIARVQKKRADERS